MKKLIKIAKYFVLDKPKRTKYLGSYMLWYNDNSWLGRLSRDNELAHYISSK